MQTLTTEQRKAILDRQIDSMFAAGYRINSRTDTSAVMVRGKKINHLLHFLIGVFTSGLWWIVWLILALRGGEKETRIWVDEHGKLTQAGVVPRRGRLVFWIAAVGVVAADQGTKAIVRGTMDVGDAWPDGWPVNIRYVTNTGAAFGSLQNATTFLIAMSLIGLAAIYLYYRNPPFQHWLASVGIGMMLGGAVGNLIDRVRLGRVTDFIHFPHWPNFNVADSSIFVGVAIILAGYLLFGETKPAASPVMPAEPHEDAPPDG